MFTPLEPGSPYCPVSLGFLHLARRGAFRLSPVEAWQTKDFTVKDGEAEWPQFCKVDLSTRKLKASSCIHFHGRKMAKRANHNCCVQ